MGDLSAAQWQNIINIYNDDPITQNIGSTSGGPSGGTPLSDGDVQAIITNGGGPGGGGTGSGGSGGGGNNRTGNNLSDYYSDLSGANGPMAQTIAEAVRSLYNSVAANTSTQEALTDANAQQYADNYSDGGLIFANPGNRSQAMMSYNLPGSMNAAGDYVVAATRFQIGVIGNQGGDGWYDTSSKLNYGVGVVAEGMSDLGKSGGSIMKIGELGGKVTIGVGIVVDGIGVYNYYHEGPNSPNAVSPGKASLNTGVAIYGIWNPEVAIGYGAVDLFWPGGWTGFIKNSQDATNPTDDIQIEQLNLQHAQSIGF